MVGRGSVRRPFVCAVLGDGARRIAVAGRMRREPGVREVLVSPPVPSCLAPGLVSFPRGDVSALVGWMRPLGVAFAIVTNERLQLAGLVDRLRAEGILAFGATQEMARRHGQRVAAKGDLRTLNVPTPTWREIEDRASLERAYGELGRLWLKRSPALGGPTVLAIREPGDLFSAWRRLADGSAQLIAEKHVDGDDIAISGLAGGGHVAVLPPVQIFRRRSSEGESLTGGMGACTLSVGPARWVATEIAERVMVPLVERYGLANNSFCGALTVRARLGENGWTVLGVDCHWRDPEIQTALAATDLYLTDILDAVAAPRREGMCLTVCPQERVAVSVVIVRDDYPDAHDYPELRYRPDVVRGLQSTFLPYDGTPDGTQICTYSGQFGSLTGTGFSHAEACERVVRDAEQLVTLHPELDYTRAVCDTAATELRAGRR